jgi:hypothetical protein
MSHGCQRYNFSVLKKKISLIIQLVFRTNVLNKVTIDPLKCWIHKVGKCQQFFVLFCHSLLVKLIVFSYLAHIHMMQKHVHTFILVHHLYL